MKAHIDGKTLNFFDGPSNPCLGIGGLLRADCDYSEAPDGSFEEFTTDLAGVRADGSFVDLNIGFDWVSTA